MGLRATSVPLRTQPRGKAKEKLQTFVGFCAFVVLCYYAYVGCAWFFDGGASSPASPGPPSLDFTVLREWKPNDDPNGYGVELLLNQDATAQELIDDIKKLSKGHDPVFISIYSSRKAYDDAKNDRDRRSLTFRAAVAVVLRVLLQ